MSSRFIQFIVHPMFPEVRLPAAARKLDPADLRHLQPLSSVETVPPLAELDLMTVFGSLIGIECNDGSVELLNFDSVGWLLEVAAARSVLAFVVPAGQSETPLAVLRFLLGEVVPFILGGYEPPLKQKSVIPEPQGQPGWGKKPSHTLTDEETLLRTMWDTPALEKEVAHFLQIERFADATYSQLLGCRVGRKTIGNYRRNYKKELKHAREFATAEIDDE